MDWFNDWGVHVAMTGHQLALAHDLNTIPGQHPAHRLKMSYLLQGAPEEIPTYPTGAPSGLQ